MVPPMADPHYQKRINHLTHLLIHALSLVERVRLRHRQEEPIIDRMLAKDALSIAEGPEAWDLTEQ